MQLIHIIQIMYLTPIIHILLLMQILQIIQSIQVLFDYSASRYTKSAQHNGRALGPLLEQPLN